MRAIHLLVVCACGTPHPPEVRVPIAARVSDAGAVKNEPIPREPNAAYAYAWRQWEAGRKREAMYVFSDMVRSLEKVKAWDGSFRKRANGTGGKQVHEGPFTVALAADGLLVADAKTGEAVRWIAVPDIFGLEAIGSGLVLVTSNDSIVLDPTSGTVVAHVPITTARSGALLAATGTDEDSKLEVWDLEKRTKRHSLTSVKSARYITFVDGNLVAVGSSVAVWDTTSGKRILDFEGTLDGGLPAFSTDGQYIAYGIPRVTERGFAGITQLMDRKTNRVVASSTACPHPTSVAFGGRYLVVGDLRRACLLEIPSMKLVAKSPETRAAYGVDDDLQATQVDLIANARAVVISSGDMTTAVALLPSMKFVWQGSATLMRSKAGSMFAVVITSAGAELRTLDETGSKRVRDVDDGEASGMKPIAEVEQADEAFARLETQTCNVSGYVFPKAACE